MLANTPRFITVTQLGGQRITVNVGYIETYAPMTAPGTGTIMQVGSRALNLSESVTQVEELLRDAARG
jgi:uncharacterized protein YlzI (FlbEa/FlbD family)